MRIDPSSARAGVLPAQSRIHAVYPSVHLADAFAIGLPPGASGAPLADNAAEPLGLSAQHYRDLRQELTRLRLQNQLEPLGPAPD